MNVLVKHERLEKSPEIAKIHECYQGLVEPSDLAFYTRVMLDRIRSENAVDGSPEALQGIAVATEGALADLSPEKDPESLVNRLKQTRFALGLSQSALAESLCISVRTLQEWEQKRRTPNGPSLTMIRMWLNVSR